MYAASLSEDQQQSRWQLANQFSPAAGLLMSWSWNWGWHHILIHIQCQCGFYFQYCYLPTLNERCYIYDKAYRVVSIPISGIMALLAAWKVSLISLPRYGISVSGGYSDRSGFKIIIINLRKSMRAKVLLFTGKALPTERHSGPLWGEMYRAVVQRLRVNLQAIWNLAILPLRIIWIEHILCMTNESPM